MQIGRPKITNRAWFKRRYDHERKMIDVSLENVAERCGNLSRMVNGASQLLSCGLVLGESLLVLKRYLEIGALASLAMFEKHMAGTKPIVATFPGQRPITISGAADPADVSSGTWTFGFYFAAIARRKDVIAALGKIPAKVYRSTTMKVPEYKNLYADAMFAFLCGKPKAAAKYLASCITLLTAEDGDASLVFLSEARTLDAILQSAPSLNRILEGALVDYKRFLDKKPELKKGPSGVVALRLLGLAAFAYDRGQEITVASDLIPRSLVEGRFAD